MATYYPNLSNQREATPTLYLGDPMPASYPEAPVLHGNMMMYLNYPSSSGSQQNCVELPLVGPLEHTPSQQGILSNLITSNTGNQSYWRDGRNEMLFMQPTGGPMTMQSIGATDDLVRRSITEDSHMSLQTQLGILHSGQNLQGQGLSLSLSTQVVPSNVPESSFQFRHPNPSLCSATGSCGDDESSQRKQSRNAEYLSPGFHGGNQEAIKREALNNIQCSMGPKQMHSDSTLYELRDLASTIPNSKYLKVAQQLLDEVVNVRKALKQHESNKQQGLQGFGSKDSKETDGGSGMPLDSQELTTNTKGELSPAEKHDLHDKMTKLLSMLDEVDRRYRQYYHQMQIIVSSFDVIAGCGAAKPYTVLALETISRHFRCLRDAIGSRIKVTRQSLGEQDTSGNNKGGGISRLRFVDQNLSQNRSLQQLGMMQQHAWRPQRGLPESSVSILRAWLFEHFLHPYPKDSDKIMLARQTGLSRSQVSNWFINARVRLWKPMVEEMYKEEFGDPEMDSISSTDNAPKATNGDIKVSEDRGEELQQNIKSATTEGTHPSQFHESISKLVPDVEMTGCTGEDSFQNRAHEEDETNYGGMRLRGSQKPNVDNSLLLHDGLIQPDGSGSRRFITSDAAYQMAELGRFGSGGGVSLTLGLQHCDGGGLSISGGTHQNFITNRGDGMYNEAPLGPDTVAYDCMDPESQRHRYGSSHLLHDFVA